MQETAASLYDMSERALEYDLLKVNVFYSSLMEKTVTDKKDYDVRVSIICTKNWSPNRRILLSTGRPKYYTGYDTSALDIAVWRMLP